jgi:hypothetical protein
MTADAETEHEHGDDERRRVDGVPEDVTEGADPYYLVDESARSGREERKVDQLELEPES